MLNKLQAVANRFEELCAKSEQPDFYSDPKKAAKLLREKNDLEPIVQTYQAYNTALQDMAEHLIPRLHFLFLFILLPAVFLHMKKEQTDAAA